MNELRLAKTCSTCKHSKFGGFKSPFAYRSTSKKQLGICMVDCNGSVPPLPSDRTLYDYAAKNGRMMDVHDYVAGVLESFDTYHEGSSNNMLEILAGEEQWKRYIEGYWYAFDFENGSLASANYQAQPHYSQMTKEEYTAGRERLYLYLYANHEASYFEELVKRIDGAVKLWDKFRANFDWWQENRDKMRRCHRNTVCDAHEDGSNRETVARSVVNGGYQLEWTT